MRTQDEPRITQETEYCGKSFLKLYKMLFHSLDFVKLQAKLLRSIKFNSTSINIVLYI